MDIKVYERIRSCQSILLTEAYLLFLPVFSFVTLERLRCPSGVASMLWMVAPTSVAPLPRLPSLPFSPLLAIYSIYPPVQGFRVEASCSSVRFAQASVQPHISCSCCSRRPLLFCTLPVSFSNWSAPTTYRAAVASSAEMEGTSSSDDTQATGTEEQPSLTPKPEEVIPGPEKGSSVAKTIFVAGSTGNTGRRIVQQLLSKGFQVRAGVRDLAKAKDIFPASDPNLSFVNANVTDSPEKLAEAISGADVVICSTGFSRSWDPFAPWKVDYFGTVNLVKACDKVGVKRFILISSILVNGAAMGQILNPAYIILNVFGLVLIAKLQAEQYIRKSGINYTIIRPGGLKNDPPLGNIVMEPEDTLYEGSISRDLVAEVAVEAVACTESSYKVVEIISRTEAPKRTVKELYGSIRQS